jgi:transaldolase
MIKIFADGADYKSIIELSGNPLVDGFTTNPSLMRKAGITDYENFARSILKATEKPVSFEVISDDFDEMYKQAHNISNWGQNVYVKIPVTNTKGVSSRELIAALSFDDVRLNITAILTYDQVEELVPYLVYAQGYVSVFAGRIADTGRDPVPVMARVAELIHNHDLKLQLIWASVREVFNVYQAEEIGCDVITCSGDIINKLALRGKNLAEYSKETVQMFYSDALNSGLKC